VLDNVTEKNMKKANIVVTMALASVRWNNDDDGEAEDLRFLDPRPLPHSEYGRVMFVVVRRFAVRGDAPAAAEVMVG
jgi:hypothetical protein